MPPAVWSFSSARPENVAPSPGDLYSLELYASLIYTLYYTYGIFQGLGILAQLQTSISTEIHQNVYKQNTVPDSSIAGTIVGDVPQRMNVLMIFPLGPQTAFQQLTPSV